MAYGEANQSGYPAPGPRKGRPSDAAHAGGLRPGPLPLWNVVLRYEGWTCVTEVVEQVMLLTGIGKDRAINAAVEARRSGRAVLLTTHRERAELYERQFARGNVTVTLEAADKSI